MKTNLIITWKDLVSIEELDIDKSIQNSDAQAGGVAQ